MPWLQFSPEARDAAHDWLRRASDRGHLVGPLPPEQPQGLLGGTAKGLLRSAAEKQTEGMGPWDFFIHGLGGGTATVLDDWKNLASFRRPTPQEATEHEALIRPLTRNTWGDIGYQIGVGSFLPSPRIILPEFFRDNTLL